jgi:hypothetical protein
MLNKLNLKNAIGKLALATCVTGAGLWSQVSLAQGHSYINYTRSSTTSHVFVQQSVEGEYGKVVSTGSKADESGAMVTTTSNQFWKGYGIGTSLGIELMKFVQFTAGHTFVNLRYRDDALERLSGSRLNAGMRLSFLAPVGNLEAGAGLLGSRLDYQKQLENASFYGSGYYTSLGLNYYMNSRVSVYFEAKMNQENLVRSSGSSVTTNMQSGTTLMGAGFRIWL